MREGSQENVQQVQTNTASYSDVRDLYTSTSGWISTADTKAGLQLTASGLLLGILTDGLISGESLLSDLTGLPLALVVVTYALLLAAVVLSLLALGPRLKKVATGSSPLSFADIASQSREEFMNAYQSLKSEELMEAYLKQIYELSIISDRKYLRVQQGTAALLASATLGSLAWILAGMRF